MTILFVSFFIAVVSCKRKRRSDVLIERQSSDTEQDQLFNTQEEKENAPDKIYSRDVPLNHQNENIDDDDNNNDINALQTDQRRLGNLQHAKEALSDKQLKQNLSQKSKMSEMNM